MQLPTRLDKYLRDSTASSLAALREACISGRVVIHESSRAARKSTDGVTPANPSTLVYPGETVMLDGQPVAPRTHYEHLILHKPTGVTTTTRDPDGLKDLSGWLRQMPPGVFPVGRLDRTTSGLLVLTNDGDLAQALLLPAHHVQKQYRLLIKGCIQTCDSRLLALEGGIPIAGDAQPVSAAILDCACHTDGTTTITLGLRQGKHRQIRKMCHAVGLRLLALHRIAVGSLELAKLAPGAFRSLESSEVESLWRDAGGRDWVRERRLRALQENARAAAAAGTPNDRLEGWLRASLDGAMAPERSS